MVNNLQATFSITSTKKNSQVVKQHATHARNWGENIYEIQGSVQKRLLDCN